MFKKKILDQPINTIESKSMGDFSNVVPIGLHTIPEAKEKINVFQQYMPVAYTNENGSQVKGVLFTYTKRLNKENNSEDTFVSILPFEKKYLDKIHRGEMLPCFNYKNPIGKLEPIKMTTRQIAELKINALRDYGHNSEAYNYLESICNQMLDLMTAQMTKKIVSLPKSFQKINIDENHDSFDMLDIISREENNSKMKELIEQSNKYEYYRRKKLKSAELKEKVVSIDNKKKNALEVLHKVDGFEYMQPIFYYDQNENRVKKGFFILKDNVRQIYQVIDPHNPNSVTKKTVTKDVPFDCLSHAHLDLLRHVKEEKIPEMKKNTITSVPKKIVIPPIKIEKTTNDKVDDLFSGRFEVNNFDEEKIYQEFRGIMKTKNDYLIFFDRAEKLLENFRYSLLFEFTLDNEKMTLEQIRHRLNTMKNYSEKDMKHFLNQLAKLTWIDNFNKDFQDKFEGENLQGGISTKVKNVCKNMFDKFIEGKYSAKKTINYWEKNKMNLMNQVQMIKQANTVSNASPKQSIWQNGWNKVKGWFGR